MVSREQAKKKKRRLKRTDYYNRVLTVFSTGKARRMRKVNTLKVSKRYVPGTIRLSGVDWYYPDAVSFAYAYEDIMLNKVYSLKGVAAPRIIDCGANIGIGSLFWSFNLAGAKITAVEADPTVFKYLEKNVSRAGCSNIKLLNRAVWYEEGWIGFSSDHADGGGIASCLSSEIKSDRPVVDVETVTLKALVDDSPVDLLKIDIEGAEVDLLNNQRECLQYVERLFVEYHSYAAQPQRLNELLGVLQEAGFRFCIQSEYAPQKPFQDLKVDCGMDNRLNIFAWKS